MALCGARAGAKIATTSVKKTMAVGNFGARLRTLRVFHQLPIALSGAGWSSVVSMVIT
jgi:hypothetical protein